MAMKLKDKVKLRREELGLTQNDLAMLIGVKQQTVHNIESGRNKGTKKINKLAKALKVTSDSLENDSSSLIVTESSQHGSAENVKSLKGMPRMNMHNDNDSQQLIKKLGKFGDRLQNAVEAPVVGYMRITEGKAMLLQTDLGKMKLLVSDPDVRCFWEDSGMFAPKYDIDEILILHPPRGEYTAKPRRNVLLTMSDGSISIYRFTAEDARSYWVRPINQDGPDERIDKSKVVRLEVIIGTYSPSDSEINGEMNASSPYIPATTDTVAKGEML